MKVRVLSKDHFDTVLPRMKIYNENVEQHLDKAFISIVDGDKEDIHYFDRDYSNVLNLSFDDATDEENERRVKNGETELALFTKEQGEKILEFVEKNKHVEIFYVHCLAGKSRSGAVGLIINDYYGEESYYEFANSNPYIKPNFFMVALLRRIYNGVSDE